jgi:hypothetical protein
MPFFLAGLVSSCNLAKNDLFCRPGQLQGARIKYIHYDLVKYENYGNLMSVCPCIVEDMKRVKPIRFYTMVCWTLWIAQHVSGIIMPIVRSLRLCRRPQRVAPHLGYGRLLVWCMAVGLTRVVQHPSNRKRKPTALHQTSHLP